MINKLIVINEEPRNYALRNLRIRKEISSYKLSGELVIGENVFPCILQEKIFGVNKKLAQGIFEGVSVAKRKRVRTVYTKQGYISFSLLFKTANIYVYIKREYLEDFYLSILGLR